MISVVVTKCENKIWKGVVSVFWPVKQNTYHPSVLATRDVDSDS